MCTVGSIAGGLAEPPAPPLPVAPDASPTDGAPEPVLPSELQDRTRSTSEEVIERSSVIGTSLLGIMRLQSAHQAWIIGTSRASPIRVPLSRERYDCRTFV